MTTGSSQRAQRRARWGAAAILLLAACGGGDGAGDGDDGLDVAADSEPRQTLPASAGDDSTVVAIVGDAGELNDDTLAVADLVAAARAGSVFTVGDNEYTTEGRTLDAYAESVGGVYGQWVTAGRFYPIPGDHDYGDACDEGDAAADLDAYLEYFDLPTGPEDETYYDVRLGDLHVFALDSLADCHRDGGAKLARQRDWLSERATASDATVKIVLLHNPPYSSGTSHGSFEDLRWDFTAWGIDLVVAGDDHIYERSTHDGVVFVVNGLGGIEAHEPGDPIEGSQVLFADAFGALIVTQGAESTEVAFVTVDGDVVDRFPLGPAASAADPETGTADESGAATLSTDATWHWQLQGTVDTTIDADVYDIDLFDTPSDVVEQLQADGRIVICYFSAGSYEGWRPDAGAYAETDLGDTLGGFEDERWLDVRSATVRAAVERRLDQAATLGCNGVEPDNVDGYLNQSGLGLTAGDQLAFNRFIADAAHARGLLVGLKNDLDQIPELVDWFDFAVNEQCHEFDECELNRPFVDAGKPVFNAEYATRFVADPTEVCAASLALGLRTLLLPLELDGSFRVSCDL